MKKLILVIALAVLQITVVAQDYIPASDFRIMTNGVLLKLPPELNPGTKARYNFSIIEQVKVSDDEYDGYVQALLLTADDVFKIRTFIDKGTDGVLFIPDLPSMEKVVLNDNTPEETEKDIYNITSSLLVHEIDKESHPDGDPLRLCTRKSCDGYHHVLGAIEVGIKDSLAFIMVGPPTISDGHPVRWEIHDDMHIPHSVVFAMMKKERLRYLFTAK